ncbi:MAG: Crp/Fnr family transcriptional regulator, partial [Gammaproteobacteria bacterium]|nr:Crp/Fnr family transcriptional regulator [Gammaproteobacteria bacterium]
MSGDSKTRLTEIFRKLTPEQGAALLEFAEFLLARQGGAGLEPVKNTAPVEIPRPLDIPRPDEESVVKAVRRLRATYPMLDARKLLNQTSELMTQHVVQGREAIEVI